MEAQSQVGVLPANGRSVSVRFSSGDSREEPFPPRTSVLCSPLFIRKTLFFLGDQLIVFLLPRLPSWLTISSPLQFQEHRRWSPWAYSQHPGQEVEVRSQYTKGGATILPNLRNHRYRIPQPSVCQTGGKQQSACDNHYEKAHNCKNHPTPQHANLSNSQQSHWYHQKNGDKGRVTHKPSTLRRSVESAAPLRMIFG